MEYEELMNKINKLSISEKILLVEDIWDSIAASKKEFKVPEEHEKEIDKRLDAFLKNPDDVEDWEKAKTEIKSKR